MERQVNMCHNIYIEDTNQLIKNIKSILDKMAFQSHYLVSLIKTYNMIQFIMSI